MDVRAATMNPHVTCTMREMSQRLRSRGIPSGSGGLRLDATASSEGAATPQAGSGDRHQAVGTADYGAVHVAWTGWGNPVSVSTIVEPDGIGVVNSRLPSM
jgi:hypothetical protein